MDAADCRQQVLDALDAGGGVNTVYLEVGRLTTIADWFVIATGTSSRHLRALAERVHGTLAECGRRPLGMEGEESDGWLLLDYGEVVVHLMSADCRARYDLESLWSPSAWRKEADAR